MTTQRLSGILLALVFLPGCGGGNGKPVETASDEAAQVIREFDDYKGSKAGFTSIFAKGAAPDEAQRKRYLKYTVAPGKVAASGETATVRVKVLDEPGEKVLTEVDWTLVREGGRWKLKAAPLP
jgi:hypothetical protein